MNPSLEKQKIQEMINGFDCVVGHNIIGFDLPVLREHLNLNFDQVKLVDTLIMSRLDNPQRDNGHSLRAWGKD